jgi:hypothetical protein
VAKLSDSVDFVRALKPRRALALHDCLLSDVGFTVTDSMVSSLAGCDYTRLGLRRGGRPCRPGRPEPAVFRVLSASGGKGQGSLCLAPSQRIRLAEEVGLLDGVVERCCACAVGPTAGGAASTASRRRRVGTPAFAAYIV